MSDRNKIIIALKALLSPIAQFCLRHGLKIQDVEHVFKVTFVEAARRELVKNGEVDNTSKLSAATGIARKFVPQYLSDESLVESKGDILTRIVGQWQSDSRYQDSKGKARALEAEGGMSEFSALVQSVTLDLNSYTVLSEMNRLGLIEKKSGKVILKSRISLIRKLPEAMNLVAVDALALQGAAEENTIQMEPNNLHLTTRYDNIPASAVAEIRHWLLDEGSKFHRKARRFISKFDRDFNPRVGKEVEERHKVHLGAFSFIETFGKENKKRK